MSWQRCSLLFSVTTDPQDRSSATAHSGGWSESHWRVTDTLSPSQIYDDVAPWRSPLLPRECAVIGYRIETFDLSGNKLIPLGSVSGHKLLPGGYNGHVDLPQNGLSFSGAANGQPNVSRFICRGLPDEVVLRGEYTPDSTMITAVGGFTDRLVVRQYGFVGRDKSLPTSRVMGLAAGVLNLSANIGGTPNVSFIRFLRVLDDSGEPITGAFPISAIAGTQYTVGGLAGRTVTHPNGLVRIDVVRFFLYGSVNPGRAVVRKVGRPFEGYRGRASRRRAS